MGTTWGPPVADRTQLGPMLAQWSLLFGMVLPGALCYSHHLARDKTMTPHMSRHMLTQCHVTFYASQHRYEFDFDSFELFSLHRVATQNLHTVFTECGLVTPYGVNEQSNHYSGNPAPWNYMEQGKSEEIYTCSCNQPSNPTQSGSKSSIFF